jgi:centrosomal protein CEP112
MDSQMVRLVEAKYKEEKIMMQQIHNAELQKLIDRKNNEIENLKISFSKTKKDYEDTVNNLDKKCQQLVKELCSNQEDYDRQVNHFKNQVLLL